MKLRGFLFAKPHRCPMLEGFLMGAGVGVWVAGMIVSPFRIDGGLVALAVLLFAPGYVLGIVREWAQRSRREGDR